MNAQGNNNQNPNNYSVPTNQDASGPSMSQVDANIQQLHRESQLSLSHGIRTEERLDRIEVTIQNLAETLGGQMSNLINVITEFVNRQSQVTKKVAVDKDGDVVMTLDEIPINHLSGGSPFKGKDIDVERFVNMCKRQFKFYQEFYKNEKRRIEYIEANIGEASNWYYSFCYDKQVADPNSERFFEELTQYYITSVPIDLTMCNVKMQIRLQNTPINK